jgi:serine/threonine-protein kinase
VDLCPKTIGGYPIVRAIGSGGMGKVYETYHPRLGTPLAIKLLPKEFLAVAGLRQRFEREARLAASIQHPAVVRVQDIGEDDLGLYMVMELVHGASLVERLAQEHHLPAREALAIARELAEVLDVAHALGVVHRDVKPANLMIDQHGRLKLLDFGVARALDLAGELTRTGQLVGTPRYMAPEQLQPACQVDARTDIFAWGAVLYELLTGRRAFDADSLGRLVTQILELKPEDPSSLRPELDPRLDVLVLRALAKAPQDRFASMRAVLTAIDAMTTVREDLAQTVVAATAGTSSAIVTLRGGAAASSVTQSVPATSIRQTTIAWDGGTPVNLELESTEDEHPQVALHAATHEGQTPTVVRQRSLLALVWSYLVLALIAAALALWLVNDLAR